MKHFTNARGVIAFFLTVTITSATYARADQSLVYSLGNGVRAQVTLSTEGEDQVRIVTQHGPLMAKVSKQILSGKIQTLSVPEGTQLPNRVRPAARSNLSHQLLLAINDKVYWIDGDGLPVEIPSAPLNFESWKSVDFSHNGIAYRALSMTGAQGGTYLLRKSDSTAIRIDSNQLNITTPTPHAHSGDLHIGGKIINSFDSIFSSTEKPILTQIPVHPTNTAATAALAAPIQCSTVVGARTPGCATDFSEMGKLVHESQERTAKYANETAPVLDPKKPREFAKGLEHMRDVMNSRVYGQTHIVDALVDLLGESLREDPDTADKALRVAMITGTTGSGKTYSADTLADYLFGKNTPKRKTQTLSMNAAEFSNPDSAWSLFGPPPGSKGFKETKGILPGFYDGLLPGEPFILVINEVEKANPVFLEKLMEVMDKGEFTGSDGKLRKFGRGLIVLTSNKGSDTIFPRKFGSHLTDAEIAKRIAMYDDAKVKELFLKADPKNLLDKKNTIADSVVNRFDRALVAAPMTYTNALVITRMEADKKSDEMFKKFGYRVDLDDETVKHVVEATFNSADGVRQPKAKIRGLIDRLETRAAMDLEIADSHHLLVKTVFDENGKHPQFVVTDVDHPELSLKLDSHFQLPVTNPLKDPVKRATLNHLEENIGKTVYGQTHAIKTVAVAVRGKAVNPAQKTPVKLALFGPSGTGKTELGIRLAENLFHDSARAKVFSMGDVKDVHQLDNFFGSSRGLIGSDTMTEFEEWISQNREGGVLIFDEFGRMGSNPKDKKQIRDRFMDMLDRGEYVTSQGEHIDLSNFVVVLTSNETQELFQGSNSDDLRMATYRQWQDPHKVEEYLKQNHDYDEAFMNRLDGNVVIVKPLLQAEKIAIGKKQLGQVMKDIQNAHEIGTLEASDDFYAQVGETFFTHSRGGRAFRSLAQQEMAELIGKPLFEDRPNPEAYLRGATFRLGMGDNVKTGKAIRNSQEAPERKVELTLTVSHPGEPDRRYSIDVTNRAAPENTVSKMNARNTAIHEAGHAVVNNPKISGQTLEVITFGGKGAYARYKDMKLEKSLTRQNAVQEIATRFAGAEAQKAFGYPLDAGYNDDLKQARQIAETAIAQYGLTDEARHLPTQNGQVNLGDPRTQKEMDLLLEDGHKLAQELVHQRMPLIAEVAHEMVAHESVSGERFLEIEKNLQNPTAEQKAIEKILKRDEKIGLAQAKGNLQEVPRLTDCVLKALRARLHVNQIH